MQVPIPCDCGESLLVSEGSAGQKVLCRCGRTVTIPSLRELRRLAGAAPPEYPADFVIEQLLLAGRLPEETACVSCEADTDGVLRITVECERARILYARTSPLYLVLALWSPLLALLAYLTRAGRNEPVGESGKDKTYALPVRLCERCRRDVADPAACRKVLSLVPLYARLLAKYPKAKIHGPETR
jgi:hypothetical protein